MVRRNVAKWRASVWSTKYIIRRRVNLYDISTFPEARIPKPSIYTTDMIRGFEVFPSWYFIFQDLGPNDAHRLRV